MNTKVAVGIAVVLAVIIGVYFYSPKATAPTTEETHESAPESEGEEETEEQVPTENEEGDESVTENTEAEETPPRTTPAVTTPAPTPPVVNTPAPAPTSNPRDTYPYRATIVYDGGRFIPDEIVIVEGGTVRFVNIGIIPMWIAPDPTHIQPSVDGTSSCSDHVFDQCESVEKGTSWSFTFERFGTWRYYNKERGKDKGKISVITEEEWEKKY